MRSKFFAPCAHAIAALPCEWLLPTVSRSRVSQRGDDTAFSDEEEQSTHHVSRNRKRARPAYSPALDLEMVTNVCSVGVPPEPFPRQRAVFRPSVTLPSPPVCVFVKPQSRFVSPSAPAPPLLSPPHLSYPPHVYSWAPPEACAPPLCVPPTLCASPHAASSRQSLLHDLAQAAAQLAHTPQYQSNGYSPY